ncbi:MAG: ectonucleotide pyrophosphatase/phosphodiesterase, partial [Saprospiraceae bacterium]
TYKIRKKELVEDGSFYSGTPIWIQAANAGMCTASYFFVGSEANIQGQYPTYYYKFDKSVASETRVAQALDWLALPEKTRPHMITMYFSDLDDIGHRVGPNNDEKIKEVLFALDEQLGKLLKGIAATGLPVNTIFVSDHGMLEVPLEKYIPVEKLHKDEWYSVVNNGTIASIHPQEGISVDSIYAYLKTKEDRFKVYKTADTPFFEYQPTNKNWGALQVIPDAGYYFNEIRYIGYKKTSGQKVFGHHGFDPELKEMHGIFYANGPAFKNGYVTPSVKNIHIYPLMCEILGLDIPTDIDGELEQLEDVLEK